jgi:hypothetical protein
MGWILSPSEYMNMVFSKSQWYPCNKILLKCPLPTVLNVHHFKKMQLNFLSGVKNIAQIATLPCVVCLFVF